jgi:uncharacterized protein (TIGR04222 family)
MNVYSISIIDYAVICGIIIAVFWVFNGFYFPYRDPSRNLNLPSNSELPDPYLLAFLRGGVNEMIRSIIISLTIRKYLEAYARSGNATISRSASAPSVNELKLIEKTVFNYFSQEGVQSVKDIYSSTALPFLVASYIGKLEENLYQRKFLTTEYEHSHAWKIGLIGLAPIVAIFVIQSELNREFSWWFISIGLIAWVILLGVCVPDKVNDLGKRYLESLKDRFPLSQRLNNFTDGDDFTLMLTVSLFGMEALEGTSFAYFQDVFKKAYKITATAELHVGCGGGCGGGGCGGCGGCGG